MYVYRTGEELGIVPSFYTYLDRIGLLVITLSKMTQIHSHRWVIFNGNDELVKTYQKIDQYLNLTYLKLKVH